MSVEEIQAKSILRKHKRIDSWFASRYGMNLYRGCLHDCAYCDGRAEGYYVEGDFGRDLKVKVNAPDILRRELDPKRKRKPFRRSYITLGGGVGDSYQPSEERYRITRQALEIMNDFDLPVHVLTKSTLVERDMDLIENINRENGAVVSMSFSSLDPELSAIFEPGVPTPEQRLATLARLKQAGIPSGMFLLPVIPFVTDTPELIDRAVSGAKAADLDFVLFGGMTLKEGRQKQHFLRVLTEHFPDKIAGYEMIYSYDKWGQATKEYYEAVNQAFCKIAEHHRIPQRMPYRLFSEIIDNDDLVVMILEHIDYYMRARGMSSPYGFAAYSLSMTKEPFSELGSEIRKVKGVGPAVLKVIREVMDTRRSSLYEELVSSSTPSAG